jgi:hypothetical protein
MGYFTYRIFKGISLDRLRKKVAANLLFTSEAPSGKNSTSP